jgi:2-dehydro-3-deoxyphosphogluconate aldolase / (4S)-4-hydroxy-2-oxoglutarate aldolase
MYLYDNFMEKLNNNPVVPVVAIEKKEDVLPLANALISGNCKIIEITLRTKEGIDAIRLLKKNNLDILIGAGTVTNIDQFKELEDIGVDFIVSPGTTDQMLQYASESTMAYLPGVMTSSEILKTMTYGFKIQKLFPAMIAGGKQALSAYSSVYGDIKFCPTGGINSENFIDFLSMSNVCAIGGTWIAKASDINNHYWDIIEERAKVINTMLKEFAK